MTPDASPESRILPEITRGHLQLKLLQRLREQAATRNPLHPWLDLSDEALLLDARLAQLNASDGLEITVAALLLLGTDEAIRAVFPHHGTQAVFRPGNWRRGEVQELRGNLLESHDRLMAFAAKHLPDHREATAEGEAFSLRDAIFGELFANSLMRRDYGPAGQVKKGARFVIESRRVFLENGRAPGADIDAVTPSNPVLAHVFAQLGWGRYAEETTSQTTLWAKAYFGLDPIVTAGSLYRILAPFPKSIAPPPVTRHTWDISEMLATQAPWTQSRAAQAEVESTRGALDALLRDPLLRGADTASALPVAQAPRSPATHPQAAPAPQPKPEPATPPARVPVKEPEAKPVAPPSPPGVRNLAAIQAERVEKILAFCRTPRYRSEVQAHVGIVNRDYFRKDILNPLIENGLLAPTLPDKPNSPKQQYATVGATVGRLG